MLVTPAPILLPLVVAQFVPVSDRSVMVTFFPPMMIGPLLLIVPFVPGFRILVIIAFGPICLSPFVLIIRSHDYRHRHYDAE